MNILIIGNGFDLAHGLPTKYINFLDFCKEAACQYRNTDRGKGWHKQEEQFLIPDIFYDMIKDNVWIEYFAQCNMHGKENWIDFESEISDVIQSIDKDMHGLTGDYNIYNYIRILSNPFLKEKFEDKHISFKELRDRLIQDLEKLIRAFEIYLAEVVEKTDIKVISPDIEKIAAQTGMGIIFNNVLNFNYTNTYERIYLNKYTSDSRSCMDYIHGKADICNSIKSNNMVLGIDEYLPKKKRNKEIEFIAFKKYYQRIHKQTGCQYKNWLDHINKRNREYKNDLYICEKEYERMAVLKTRSAAAVDKLEKIKSHFPMHNLYIFGHSLDVTDKDVLKEMILTDHMYTTIYYRNKEQLGRQIANLVKVIGKKEVIRRTGGDAATIKFVQQQEMKKREGAEQ